MSSTVEVKGLKELSEALKGLPEKLRGRTLGAAVKAGADLVRDVVRENARATFKEPTGATERSIVAYHRKGSTPDSITYEVGVTMKKKWPKNVRRAASGSMGRGGSKSWPAFWWIFTEFGAAPHEISAKFNKALSLPGGAVQKVNHPGVAARPWFRPAWAASSGAALVMIKGMLERAIPIAVAQLPKYTGSGR